MDGKKALYYAAIAIAVLLAVSVIGTLLSIAVGVTLWAVGWLVNIAVVAAALYLAYKAGTWLLSGDDGGATIDSIGGSRSSSSASPGNGGLESRQDRLRRQYVEGQITEEEFERRIASELETEELDDIDRELERER
ncbi:hypothetical protein [Halorubrum trueperi]|uniref:SHOCT domain-containing protein n=1 Tax=Halorubrum trueperi TaxID=2004704 RepID=A0ABD5UED2_9EURY